MKKEDQNFVPEYMPFCVGGHLRWYRITNIDTLKGGQDDENEGDQRVHSDKSKDAG